SLVCSDCAQLRDHRLCAQRTGVSGRSAGNRRARRRQADDRGVSQRDGRRRVQPAPRWKAAIPRRRPVPLRRTLIEGPAAHRAPLSELRLADRATVALDRTRAAGGDPRTGETEQPPGGPAGLFALKWLRGPAITLWANSSLDFRFEVTT